MLKMLSTLYTYLWFILPVSILVILSGCSSQPQKQPTAYNSSTAISDISPFPNNATDGPPPFAFDASVVPDIQPQPEPLSRYGNKSPYSVLGETYYIKATNKNYKEQGLASWYGIKFHGRKTSSGEPYNMFGLSAAHRTLPIPSYVKVTNLSNNKSTVVKVNDRGPFHSKRLIDLSYAAACKLGIDKAGTARVEIEALNPVNYAANTTTSASATLPSLEAHPYDMTNLFLQVGAFKSLNTAEELLARLKNVTATAGTILSTEMGNGSLHRVRLGPIANYEQAKKLITLIEDSALGSAFIVLP